MNLLLKYLLIFAGVILAQLFLFEPLRVSPYLNIHFFIFYILVLPVRVRGVFLLLTSFLLGALVDLFSGTGGVFTIASTALAFCRGAVLRLLLVKDDDFNFILPVSSCLGTKRFLVYAGIMVLLFNIFVFIVYMFTYRDMFHLFPEMLSGAALNLFLVYFVQLILFNPKTR